MVASAPPKGSQTPTGEQTPKLAEHLRERDGSRGVSDQQGRELAGEITNMRPPH